jgi:RNA recognition motif-containing protein
LKQRIVVEEDSMDSITASDLRTEGDFTMAEIFLTNLPHDCSDHELRQWVESRGIEVKSTRIILDLETGVAPAFGYVEIESADFVKAGAASLNGRKLRSNKVMAKPVQIVPHDFNRSTVSP